MNDQSNREDLSDSDSSSKSQVSPRSSERRRNKRRRNSTSPDAPAEERATTADPEASQAVPIDRDGSVSSELASDVCICQPDPKIPRPRNAFILYRQHHQPGLVAQFPGLTEPQISKIVGEQWRHQPDEIKEEWKTRAEEVKVRHQLQYPDYRYQPRRLNRRNSTVDSATSVSQGTPCEKCGGRITGSPITPSLPDSSRSMPAPQGSPSGIPQPHGRHINAFNSMNMLSPQHNFGTTHPILMPTLSYPNPQQLSEDAKNTPLIADNKRRRFSNGTYFLNGRQSISGPFPSTSPYREVFVRPDSIPKWPHPSTFMGPPPRPTGIGRQTQRPQNITVAPQVKADDQSKSVQAMVMSMPYMGKIAILGRIAPPLRADDLANLKSETRGALIAVEGDNEEAVAEAVKWLGETLGRKSEYSVRTAQGPKIPKVERDISVSDYISLMIDWHSKSREIITFITTPPTSPDSQTQELDVIDLDAPETGAPTATTKHATRIPLVLLERYQLYASNAFASAIPIRDNYSPTDHWQWMATLWRDTVGPDLTVYIKDPSDESQNPDHAENDNGNTEVEVKKEVRCILVPRKKSASGEELKLQDVELRRLAFEIGEWARAVAAKPKGPVTSTARRATLENA